MGHQQPQHYPERTSSEKLHAGVLNFQHQLLQGPKIRIVDTHAAFRQLYKPRPSRYSSKFAPVDDTVSRTTTVLAAEHVRNEFEGWLNPSIAAVSCFNLWVRPWRSPVCRP